MNSIRISAKWNRDDNQIAPCSMCNADLSLPPCRHQLQYPTVPCKGDQLNCNHSQISSYFQLYHLEVIEFAESANFYNIILEVTNNKYKQNIATST